MRMMNESNGDDCAIDALFLFAGWVVSGSRNVEITSPNVDMRYSWGRSGKLGKRRRNENVGSRGRGRERERLREGFLQPLTNSSACSEAKRFTHKPLPHGLGGTPSALI